MEVALTIMGMGILDAIVTQMMKDAKRQSLVIWVRIGTTAFCVLTVAPDIFNFFEYAKAVLLRWY